MKCATVRDRLSRYVEGALSGAEQAVMARHLAACAACRAEAEGYQRAEEALRSLAAVVPAPDLTADLRRRLTVAGPAPRPFRWVWAGAALAAVAAAAALVALRAPALRTPPQVVVRQRTARTSPRQLAIQPVTEGEGVLRPTAPSHPSPAVLHHPSAPRHNVHRVRRNESPALSARDGALEAKETEIAAVTLHSPRSHAPRPFLAPDGVVLLVAASQPALPAANCRVEVLLPDGSTSVREQIAAPDAAGEERVVRVTYQTTGPDTGPEWRPQ